MIPLLVAMTTTMAMLYIQTEYLAAREPALKAKEQAFRFHELRDRLQALFVEGYIEIDSLTYQFLVFSLNLSIRNAGKMKLTELLEMAKIVEKRVNKLTFDEIRADIQLHDVQVQQLAAEFFKAFAWMLVSNDRIISVMAFVLRAVAEKLNEALIKPIRQIAQRILPERAEALAEARKYERWGRLLSPSF
jgi:hypothetical protein